LHELSQAVAVLDQADANTRNEVSRLSPKLDAVENQLSTRLDANNTALLAKLEQLGDRFDQLASNATKTDWQALLAAGAL
jgi:hypothetical protein